MGPHLVRSAGGGWERFFFLSLFLWTAYLLTLMTWAFFVLGSIDASWRVFLASFSYLSLGEVWLTPIMSASIMRATIGKGINKDDDNVRLFADYLQSLGHGGHWPLGNTVSLAYFGIFLAWTFVAYDFPSLTGTGDVFSFGLVDVSLLLLLGLLYHLLLKRLLGQARRAGYPIRYARRWSS
jgi:hypothetical protein